MKPIDWLRRFWRDLTDDPDHEPRPEDADCAECHRLRQECLALEQRLGKEQEKVRAMESLSIAASQQSRELVDEYPLDDDLLRPKRIIPHTTTMVDVGTREPNVRAEAPTWTPERVAKLVEESRAKRASASWNQTRMRVADRHRRTVERVPAPFGMTERQARGNRAKVLTTGELADRFVCATQAAREIGEEQS